MKRFEIQVKVPVCRKTPWGSKLTDEYQWVCGRPTEGPDYEYLTREQAIDAAKLWGDAYTRGDVRVVEIHDKG